MRVSVYTYICICGHMYAFYLKTTVYYTHRNICYVIEILSAVVGLRIYILYNIHLVK